MRPCFDCLRQVKSERPVGARATCLRPSSSLCILLAWRHVPSTKTASARGPDSTAPLHGTSSASSGARARTISSAGRAAAEGNRTKARLPAEATAVQNRAMSAGTPCRKTSQSGRRCSNSLPVFEARDRSLTCIHTAKRTPCAAQRGACMSSRSLARRTQMQWETNSAHCWHLPRCCRVPAIRPARKTAIIADRWCSATSSNLSRGCLVSTRVARANRPVFLPTAEAAQPRHASA
mmetsp:Transcript_667/g.2352  ORF Transcript_667/g.2352 Transcript_667/m.2352 type:complete len:235 (+) Transcript_667:264-968(+)